MENVSTPSVDTQERIRKVVDVKPIEVSRVYASPFQKEGTLTAELKQTTETKSFYPSKSVSNNLQDNPFTTQEFGFSEQEFDSIETRVAWIDVPNKFADKPEEVLALLKAKFPTAGLYKILANKPIISDAQQNGIERGLTTIDIIGNGQAVRYPKGAKLNDVLVEGKLIMDINGKVQYRGVYYSNTPKEDKDLRTTIVGDVYHTPEILAEMTNTPVHVEGQTVTL